MTWMNSGKVKEVVNLTEKYRYRFGDAFVDEVRRKIFSLPEPKTAIQDIVVDKVLETLYEQGKLTIDRVKMIKKIHRVRIEEFLKKYLDSYKKATQ